MPAPTPAAEIPVTQRVFPRTENRAPMSHESAVQAQSPHHQLENRARWVGALDRSVLQRVQRVVQQLFPFGMADADHEFVGIIRGQADLRQNLARSGE